MAQLTLGYQAIAIPVRLNAGLVAAGILALMFLPVGVKGLRVVCIISDRDLFVTLVDR